MSPELVTLLASAVGPLMQAIITAIQAGDVKTVDELAKVLPKPEVLALRDQMLIEAEDAKDAAARARLGS